MHALKHYKYKYYSTMCSFCLLYDLNYVVGNNLFLFFFSSFSVVYCQLNMISHEKVFLFATNLKMDRPHLLLNFNILTLFINFLDCIVFLTSHFFTLPIYIYTISICICYSVQDNIESETTSKTLFSRFQNKNRLIN